MIDGLSQYISVGQQTPDLFVETGLFQIAVRPQYYAPGQLVWGYHSYHKKIMKISSFYFGPGSPKKWFLRFFRKIFTKKWAGNTESRVRRRLRKSRVRRRFRNLEWSSQASSIKKIRKTENPLPRGSRVSVVSLEIPGIVVSLEIPVIVVSLVIPYFQPIFS